MLCQDLECYLKTSVVEGGEDGDGRVNVFQFSQESSVKVRVHVAVDPVKKLLSDVIGKEKVI